MAVKKVYIVILLLTFSLFSLFSLIRWWAIFCFQVSDYLRKQVIEAEQAGAGENEDVKKMLADHDKLVEEIFQHEDKDKNGFISHDEFSGPKHDEL